MTIKKVPLTFYDNGKRVVVGDAFVEVVGPYVSVDAKINDEYAHLVEADVKSLSLGPISAKEARCGDSS